MNKKPKHFTNNTGYDLKLFLFAILFYCLIKSVPMGLMASPVLISTCACFCISGIMYRNDNFQARSQGWKLDEARPVAEPNFLKNLNFWKKFSDEKGKMWKKTDEAAASSASCWLRAWLSSWDLNHVGLSQMCIDEAGNQAVHGLSLMSSYQLINFVHNSFPSHVFKICN